MDLIDQLMSGLIGRSVDKLTGRQVDSWVDRLD